MLDISITQIGDFTNNILALFFWSDERVKIARESM